MVSIGRFKIPPFLLILIVAIVIVLGADALVTLNTNNGGNNNPNNDDSVIQAEVNVIVTYTGSFTIRIMSLGDNDYQNTYENKADVLVRRDNPENWTVGVSAKKLDGGSGTLRIQIWGANGDLLKDSETRTPGDMDLAVWREIPVSSAYPQFIDSTNKTANSIIVALAPKSLIKTMP